MLLYYMILLNNLKNIRSRIYEIKYKMEYFQIMCRIL